MRKKNINYEKLLRVWIKQRRDLSFLMKYKNLLLALVLTHLDETFDYFQERELKGSPIFDLSCDELVDSLRQQKELAAQISNENNLEQAEIEEKINRTILILLMSIYADAMYFVHETGWQESGRMFAQMIPHSIQYSLSLDENKSICEKIIKLSGLLDSTLVEPDQNFLFELANSKYREAKELCVPVAVIRTLIYTLYWFRNKQNQKITKAKFIKQFDKSEKLANRVNA